MRKVPRILAGVLTLAMVVTSVPFSPVSEKKTAEAASSADKETLSDYTYEKLGSVVFDKATPVPTETPDTPSSLGGVTSEDTASEEGSVPEANLSPDDGYDYYVRYKKQVYNGENVKLQFVRTGLGENVTGEDSNVEIIYYQEDFSEFPSVKLRNNGVNSSYYGSSAQHESNYGSEEYFPYSYFVKNSTDSAIDYEIPSGEKTYDVTIGEFHVNGSYYDENYSDYYSYSRGSQRNFSEYIQSKDIKIKVNWVSPVTFDESENNKSTDVIGVNSADVYAPTYELEDDFSGSSLQYQYTWQQLDDNNDEDDKWEYISSDHNKYTAYSSKTVRCILKAETDDGYPVAAPYTSEEYTVNIAKSYPVRFSDGSGDFVKSAQRTIYVDKDTKKIKLRSDPLESEGYDIKYQWSELDLNADSDTYYEYVDIDGADKENYTVDDTDFTYTDSEGNEKSSDTKKLKITATASLSDSDDVVYTATSTFTLSKTPYLYSNDPENWSRKSQSYAVSAGVGETVKGTIPIKGFGYDLSYQWYQIEPEYASSYSQYGIYTDGSYHYILNDIRNDENEGEGYTELSNEDKAAFSHKMTSSDFDYTDDDDKYYHIPAVFICKVTAKNDDDEVIDTELFTMTVNENWDLTKAYDENESESAVVVKPGESAEIVSTKYVVNDGYKVSYQWSELDDDPQSDTAYEYVDLEDETDRTLKTEKFSSLTETSATYKCTVTVKRNKGDAELEAVSNTYQVTAVGDTKLNVSRTSPSYQNKEIGSSATMGVKAEINDSSYTLKYKWTLNDKSIDCSKDSYTVSKTTVKDYGTYVCTVTAEDEDGETAFKKTVVFTLEEDTGLKLLSPYETDVNGKTVGDKVDLSVKAESDTDSELSYKWYRKNDDEYSSTSDSYKLIDDETKDTLSLTLTDDDFTTYKVVVSDSHSTVSAYYYLNDENYGAYAEISGTSLKSKTYYKTLDDALALKIDTGSDKNDVTFSYKWFKRRYQENYGYNEYRLLDDVTGNEYDLTGGKESEFGTYLVEVTGVNANEKQVYSADIYFYINEDNAESADSFRRIAEFGENAYNRTGDKVRFGVEHSEGKGNFTYSWTFAQEYETESGNTSFDTQYPEELDVTESVISYDAINDGQFGRYTLTVKKVSDDKDQEDSIYDTYTFDLRKYTGTELTAKAKGDYTSYGRAVGQDVTFNVEAETDGSDEITYQWYYGGEYNDGNALYGETGSSLTLEKLTRNDFGDYRCKVSAGDSYAWVEFNVYRTGNLEVENDNYSGDTTYVSKNIGEKATFAVKATSDKEYPITYTWYKDGDRINGESGPSLTLSDIKRKDLGRYSVNISNGTDPDVNRYFVLRLPDDYYLKFVEDKEEEEFDNGVRSSVKAPDSERVRKTVYSSTSTDTSVSGDMRIYAYADENGSVEVNAQAEAADGYNVNYQWQKFDDVQNRWIDIDGATDEDYTITDVDFDDRYRCIAGTEASDLDEMTGVIAAYVTLRDVKDLDKFYVTVDRDYAVEGMDVTFTATLNNPTSGIDYEYQWYTEDADGNLAKVDGATSNTLTVKAPEIKQEKGAVLEKDAEDDDPVIKVSDDLYYYCKVTGGKEENTEEYSAAGMVEELIAPSSYDSLPQSLIFDGNTVQGYKVDNAEEIRIVLDKAYSIKGFGNLSVIDENGNVVYYYPDEDDNDASGQDITVKGSTVYFYMDINSTGKTAASSYVTAKALAAILDNGSSKLGYSVSRIGVKTVLDAEDEAAAKAAADKEAADAAAKAKDDARRKFVDNQMKAASLAAIASKSGVTDGLLTVNKKKVIVAAGKTVKVGYKAVVTSGDSITDVTTCTAVSKNKKLVKVSVPDTQFINIKAPKKATKGASTKVTVSHGQYKVNIKVTIKNKAKKIKAAKKKVTAKAGKKFTVTLKVTAQNKKKASTDKVKASNFKKLAKLTKTKVSKGKAVLTFKAKKKAGKAKISVKVGSAKAKVTLVVSKKAKKKAKSGKKKTSKKK